MIAENYRYEHILTMTARQAQAFVQLAERRKRRETRELLYLNAIASRGDQKALKRASESLAKDG